MNTSHSMEQALSRAVRKRRGRLIEITQKLVKTPSENTPPRGAEQDCQQWLASQLQAIGLKPDLYALNNVESLLTHPLFLAGREYGNRPNLAARLSGGSAGRSLVLSGHIDTVPRGTQDWSADPFSAEVKNDRIYGRGSNDMKAGVATNLFIFECLAELKLKLRGDLVFESVIDEEFGGCNGTLAARLRGYNTDAAILSEPSSLRICPAQRGGRTAHITLRNPSGGVLQKGSFPSGIIPQLTCLLEAVPRFASTRRASVSVHELYRRSADPVPVAVTKVFSGPWGNEEPVAVPDSARVELFWQLMPGEKQPDVEREFFAWLEQTVAANPTLFHGKPEISFPIRWLPGSAISPSEPLVQELSACAQKVLGTPAQIAGIEGPCDLFVFHEFGIPAVLWGASGGNTHAADEYVDIESLVLAAETLLLFVVEWCGVQ